MSGYAVPTLRKTLALVAGSLALASAMSLNAAAGSIDDPEVADAIGDISFFGLKDPLTVPIPEVARYAGLYDLHKAWVAPEGRDDVGVTIKVASLPDTFAFPLGPADDQGTSTITLPGGQSVTIPWDESMAQSKIQYVYYFDVRAKDASSADRYRVVVTLADVNLVDPDQLSSLDAIGQVYYLLAVLRLTLSGVESTVVGALPDQNLSTPVKQVAQDALGLAGGGVNTLHGLVSQLPVGSTNVYDSARGALDNVRLGIGQLSWVNQTLQAGCGGQGLLSPLSGTPVCEPVNDKAPAPAGLLYGKPEFLNDTYNSTSASIFSALPLAAGQAAIHQALGQADGALGVAKSQVEGAPLIPPNEKSLIGGEIQLARQAIARADARVTALPNADARAGLLAELASAHAHINNANGYVQNLPPLNPKQDVAKALQDAHNALSVADSLLGGSNAPAGPVMLFHRYTLEKFDGNAWNAIKLADGSSPVSGSVDLAADTIAVTIPKANISGPRKGDFMEKIRLESYALNRVASNLLRMDFAPDLASDGTPRFGRNYEFQWAPTSGGGGGGLLQLEFFAEGAREQAIDAGGAVSYRFTIRNPAAVPASCSLTLNEAQPGWSQELSANSCSLAAGQSATFALVVSVLPGAAAKQQVSLVKLVEDTGGSKILEYKTSMKGEASGVQKPAAKKKGFFGVPGFETVALLAAGAAVLVEVARRRRA